MAYRSRVALVAILAASVAGCTLPKGDPDSGTKSGPPRGDVEESTGSLRLSGTIGSGPQAQLEAQQARIDTKVPITSVRRIEIGRTRDGVLVSAFGLAPGLGYSLPVLQARRGGRPNGNGIVEFDFVVTAPDPALDLPDGSLSARKIRADLPIAATQLGAVRGFRVIALDDAQTFLF